MDRFIKICRQTKKNGSVFLFINVPTVGADGKKKYVRQYLGKEGDPATDEKIYELKRQWYLTNGKAVALPRRESPVQDQTTVAQLCLAFLEYISKDYSETSQEPAKYARVLSQLVDYCGSHYVASFNLIKFEAFRRELIQSGRLCRKEVNARITKVKRCFKWGAVRKMVPLEVNAEVQLLESVQIGRQQTYDNPPVQPVSLDDVAKTLPFLSTPVASMVRLQLLTGARPEEIRIMRPCDIDRTDHNGCWIYRPSHDKTQRFRAAGQRKQIPINKEAQRIIEVQSLDLPNDSQTYIFRPTVALAEIRADRSAKRKSKITPSQKKRAEDRKKNPKEKISDHYSARAYHHAIEQAAKKAGVPHWFPYQLRHTTATEIQRHFGLEAAKAILGHRSVATTMIYVEPDQDEAARILSEFNLMNR